MPGILIAALLASAVGIGGTLLANWLNRDLLRITEAANDQLRRRLGKRSPLPMRELILESGVPEVFVLRAERLLAGIGEELDVDPRLLRWDDRLDDLLRIQRNDLNTVTLNQWERAGLKEYIDVFSYGLMDKIDELSERSEWEKWYAGLPDPPGNEEEWVDLLMSMNVRELLNVFAPVVRKRERK